MVLLITLNRPQARNSFDLAAAEGLARALDRLDEDDDLRVGVLTGAEGGFSAGMDLKAFARGEVPYVAGRGVFGIANDPPRKPLIAAIEGFALAGGFEVALACDLIVASRGSRLGLPEVKRGLCAASGGLMQLSKRIPYHAAMEMALTGEPVSAERAAELGLVNRLAEPGAALEDALELAMRIAANAPLAVEASKQILAKAFDWSSDDAWSRQGEIAGPVLTSEDAAEGTLAFRERREPVWRRR